MTFCHFAILVLSGLSTRHPQKPLVTDGSNGNTASTYNRPVKVGDIIHLLYFMQAENPPLWITTDNIKNTWKMQLSLPLYIILFEDFRPPAYQPSVKHASCTGKELLYFHHFLVIRYQRRIDFNGSHKLQQYTRSLVIAFVFNSKAYCKGTNG